MKTTHMFVGERLGGDRKYEAQHRQAVYDRQNPILVGEMLADRLARSKDDVETAAELVEVLLDERVRLAEIRLPLFRIRGVDEDKPSPESYYA